MKTYVHLLQYLAEFFLQRENIQTKFVEKIKARIFMLLLSLQIVPFVR